MSDMELLIWARGIGFRWALAVFIFGMVLRAFEMFSLGRKRDLSLARADSPGSGWRTVLSRSLPQPSVYRRAPATYILGYVFHFGLLITVAFFVPHIQLVRNTFGLSWPGLPTPLVDAVALITLATLLLVLANRLRDPVKRFLSGFEDYFTLALAFMPMLSGYLAFHHQVLPYTLMLALHILSVELLLVFMPFTKLAHFATLFVARWYNGDIAGRKGVAA
jgi:nitrate reductase gamma subunit